MTILSVNVNKIALLRNSRGRDFPSVTGFAEQVIGMGVKGITVHPRPDQRHVTRKDVFALTDMLRSFPAVEFNIEGYPSNDFIELVLAVKPAQCTLVPDLPGQLTSDHGWDVAKNEVFLSTVLTRLKNANIRSSLFLDPSAAEVELVSHVGADRIELYTESFAESFSKPENEAVFNQFVEAAAKASALGIGLNAGHDLNLENLPKFLQLPNIIEVSIGHALIIESIELGIKTVIERYLAICSKSKAQ
ncbi:MAG: pyridoxine 5-phosphate synthase [Pseudohongiellaceae bacterium]|jgi:pyridoxine 5-phosphate synthase